MGRADTSNLKSRKLWISAGSVVILFVAPMLFTLLKVDSAMAQISLGGIATITGLYLGSNVMAAKYGQD